MNYELPDVQAGFRKCRGTREQIANIHWIIEKATEFQKNIYFFLLTMSKPLAMWISTNSGKFFFKIWQYLDLALEKSVCRSGSNSQNLAWNNRLVPNWERSTSRLYIVTLLI